MEFNEQLEYVRSVRKADMNKFNKVTDITHIVDFHNQMVEAERDAWAEDQIHEISKFLARIQNRKTFVFKGKK